MQGSFAAILILRRGDFFCERKTSNRNGRMIDIRESTKLTFRRKTLVLICSIRNTSYSLGLTYHLDERAMSMKNLTAKLLAQPLLLGLTLVGVSVATFENAIQKEKEALTHIQRPSLGISGPNFSNDMVMFRLLQKIQSF
jgi:hypothetical protein